jgi:hypothetical protein
MVLLSLELFAMEKMERGSWGMRERERERWKINWAGEWFLSRVLGSKF